MGRILKRVLIGTLAAVMIGAAMGCPKPSESAPPSTQASGTATYKCGCGNTKTVAASAPAPSC